MQGFKSFANRVELSFLPGVAAVVGPNGSGKSNIADAIRWVLGEQSVRSLRGTRVQDIIFSGSSLRRPLGMAEVSIVLDNTSGLLPLEYSEVTITRRVFRSGDSQFAINKTPCRLRDIQDLLLDSGIGRGSLSLVGQGEVDAILNAAPEQRRLLLEDAAGITRYRTRREEALEKLAETGEDLLRVDDLIAEIVDRLDPLKEAAEKAERHLQLSSKARRLEIALLCHDKRRLERNALREAQQHDRVVAEKERLTSEISRIQESRNQSQLEVERILGEIEAMRERLQLIREHEQQLTHHIELATEKANQAQRDLQRSIDSRKALDLEVAGARRAIDEASTALGSLRSNQEKTVSALAEIERAHVQSESQVRALTQQLEQLRQRLAEKERVAALCEGELRSEPDSERESDQLRQLKRERANCQLRISEVTTEREQIKSRLTEIDSALVELQNAVDQTESSLRKAAADGAKLDDLYTEQLRLLSDVESRFRVLESMADSYEGYFQGVRNVLASRHEIAEGILGSVAELIRVPSEFELAIEIALGNSMQSIVTLSEHDAEEAIAFLKSTRSGRATFLPLDALRYRLFSTTERQALVHPDLVGIAADLVSCHPQVKPALDFLLGRTVLTRTLQSALALSKRVRGFQRVVSLDGDLVTPGGAITGGSSKRQSSGLLSRRRELDELGNKIAALRQEVAALEKARADAQQRIDLLERRLEALNNKRHRTEIARTGAMADATALDKEWQRLCDLDRQLTQQEHEINRLTQRRFERLAQLHEQLKIANDEKQALQAEVADVSERLDLAVRSRDDIQAELTRAGLTAAKIAHEKEAAVVRLSESKQALSVALRRIEDEEERIRDAEQLLAELAVTLEQQGQQLAAARIEYGQCQRQLQELREHHQVLQAESASLAANERELRDSRDEIQDQIQTRAVALARAQAAVANINEKLADLNAEDDAAEAHEIPA
ncbi:MAG: chromosome segregation protein SMC, partial [Limnochordia bacterium]